MKKIKQPAVAGKFYTEDKKELLNELNEYERKNVKEYNYTSRAIIVPHAGYFFSGKLASKGFQYLDREVKNIFIFAPVHTVPTEGIALSENDIWQTPLGEIEVNQQINKELVDKFNGNYFEPAFESEHAIEVQVPFIQKYYSGVKIVPILVGLTHCSKIAQIIDYYWQNKDNAFVISSDLSHFYPHSDAVKIDKMTAELIETNNTEEFNPQRACGSLGICGLMEFAKKNEFSLIRVGMTNSAESSGDTSRVVGYGSWLLYENSKNNFIKKYFSDTIAEYCQQSIAYGLKNNTPIPTENLENIPQVLYQYGASFVTLTINNDLRGCIGSIIAHQSLIKDLVSNAYNAAFADSRFYPLTEDEYENVKISISLLSSPEEMDFKDEQDLLNQIRPFIDGIIIKDGINQAVYLPSVWEQLPDKVMFLNSLKQKAGLSPHHFSKNFQAFRYTTEYIN